MRCTLLPAHRTRARARAAHDDDDAGEGSPATNYCSSI
eukprot:COSAG05_NODE_7349_length_824_cov_0.902069_1_plen_37_part_01